MKKIIILFVTIFVISFTALLFLNTGFNANSWEYLQSFILALTFTCNLIWPRTRRITLFLAVVFILPMIVLFTLKRIDMANAFGSTAIGIVSLSMVSYLPQLVKKGYIEKL
ncbi:MAG: hypothetical protein AAB414_02340 [Patescibacteria group bacterium]